MSKVELFLQVWSIFLGAAGFLLGVMAYLSKPAAGTLITGKTFPYKEGSTESTPLLETEGIDNANIKSWGTRNAAIGLACLVAGIFLKSSDGYIMAFTLCAYREFFDVTEKSVFEPKDPASAIAFGIMGIIDFVALYFAIKL